MYRRGKTSVFKLFEKNDLTNCVKVFTKIDSTPQTIITEGIRFLLAVYGAPKKITCINKYRYLTFVKNTRNKKQIQLSCLPFTSASAIQHLYRVYYQVQTWLDNQLNPEDWGWKLIDNTLEPIKTLLPPAPEKLLNTIFCNCRKGCTAKCGCKKIGLQCTSACTNCQVVSSSIVEILRYTLISPLRMYYGKSTIVFRVMNCGALSLAILLYAVIPQSGLFSADKVNRSFDTKASGFSGSDSIGTIFLQRAENAKRVYAVVVNLCVKYTEAIPRNTCLFPITEFQAQIMKQTLKHCGLKPRDVTYIEADGTAIKSMDLEELKAIDLVSGQDRSLSNPLLIGSVKSNIGYTYNNNAINSVIKLNSRRGDNELAQLITDITEKQFPYSLYSEYTIGLVDILYAFGVKPNYMIRHPVGELSCFYVDGCLTAEEMILSALSRGLALVESDLIHGTMAVVGLGYKQLQHFCPEDIDIAYHNGSDSSTISGPTESIKAFVKELQSKGIFAKTVPTSNNDLHSRYICPADLKLLEHLKKNWILYLSVWQLTLCGVRVAPVFITSNPSTVPCAIKLSFNLMFRPAGHNDEKKSRHSCGPPSRSSNCTTAVAARVHASD
ncbi:hypothetical protein M0804_006423 [Polistes exclamans]|nr:hypothetical protein M0804_006423 [Polistes exclamans]